MVFTNKISLSTMFILVLLVVGIHHSPQAVENDQPFVGAWEEQKPEVAPYTINHLASTYDTTADKYIVFSGRTDDYGLLKGTWVYDIPTNTWTNRTPDVVPPVRQYSFITYHEPADKTVLFAGASSNGIQKNDMWLYDYTENNWTEIFPDVKPNPIKFHIMESDPVDNTILFYGGIDLGWKRLSQFWVFDFETMNWTQSHNPTIPNAEENIGMGSLVYADDLDKTFLFGLKGVWEYDRDSGNFTQLEVQNQPSPNRDFLDVVYDTEHDKFVLFGGCELVPYGDTPPCFDETFIFDYPTRSWTNLTADHRPDNRHADSNIEYSPNHKVTIMFGGSNEVDYYNDTWLFTITDTRITSSSSVTSSSSSSSSSVVTDDTQTSTSEQGNFFLSLPLVMIVVIVRYRRLR